MREAEEKKKRLDEEKKVAFDKAEKIEAAR